VEQDYDFAILASRADFPRAQSNPIERGDLHFSQVRIMPLRHRYRLYLIRPEQGPSCGMERGVGDEHRGDAAKQHIDRNKKEDRSKSSQAWHLLRGTTFMVMRFQPLGGR
jgi:hypothetical protein